MKKKLAEIKTYVKCHKDEIGAGVLVSALAVGTYFAGVFIGKIGGYAEGYNDCNESWFNVLNEVFKIKED